MAKVTYTHASEVEEIAERLIRENHPHLTENCIRVQFLFRDDEPKKSGKATWGVARKVSGLSAYLAGSEEEVTEDRTGEPFFVIVITEAVWKELKPAMREALVDHELSHCATKLKKDGEVQLFIRPHDLEEFNKIVERYGLWRRDVELFLKSARKHQPELPLDIEEGELHAGNGNGNGAGKDGAPSHVTLTLTNDAMKTLKEAAGGLRGRGAADGKSF